MMKAQFRIVVEFVRHKLDHDTESGLWPLFYWVVGARSEVFKGEHQPWNTHGILSGLILPVTSRICLFKCRLDHATRTVY